MKTISMNHARDFSTQLGEKHSEMQEITKSGTAGECFTFALIGAIAMALVLVLMTALG